MLLQAGSTILKKGKRTKLKQPKKQTDNTESEISVSFLVAFSQLTNKLAIYALR